MNRRSKNYFLILLSLLAFSGTALPYTPQYADDAETVPLRWRSKIITVSLSNSFFKENINITADSNISEAVRKSFEAWENIADIKFDLQASEKQAISAAGKSGDGTSLITIAQTPENLLLFSGENSETAAFTRVFFNRRGNIAEADIVLNPYARFSTDGSIGTFDLQATLTHEIGHLLGLAHSTVSGSTMFEHQGKNGTYSLSNFSFRTLSEDDITGIRGLYGAEVENENCCGVLQGKITVAKLSKATAVELWLEEINSGKTVAALRINSSGKIKISGLSEGQYRIFAQDRRNDFISAENLGEVEISKGKITFFTEQFSPANKKFDLKFLGFNGQISDTTIPVNRGNSYIIYFAGKNIENENFELGFNSRFLTVNRQSLTKHNYGDEFAVYSVELRVDSDTPMGDYSLFFKDENGMNDFIIGGISVDEMPNPWTHRSF
ncbi:MAG: matrixin family metalloprotease [Pyrinomonadaceae bacterium]